MQRLADLTNFVQKCRSLESDISELVELTSIIDEDDVEVEKQLLEEITRVEEELSIVAVSYTHLRANETDSYHV